MIRLGIDLGGTKIEGIALDDNGKELCRRRIDTQQEQGYEHILLRVREVYAMVLREVGGSSHTLGIGTPGAVSQRTGLLKNSNTVCLNGKPFREDLRKVLRRDFMIQNDANCFAMAEARLGAGREKNLVFGIILGTGCGGGLEKRFAAGCGETLPLKEIVRRYRAGEEKAVLFMKTFFGHFGRALANLINVLDPDVVVLGGGVSNIEELYTEGVSEVRSRVFSDSLETPIIRHTLGDSAGVIGAALIGN